MRVLNVANLVGLFLTAALVTGCGMGTEERNGNMSQSQISEGPQDCPAETSIKPSAGERVVYSGKVYARLDVVFSNNSAKAWSINADGSNKSDIGAVSFAAFSACYKCHNSTETHVPGKVALAGGVMGTILERCANNLIVFKPDGTNDAVVYGKGLVYVAK